MKKPHWTQDEVDRLETLRLEGLPFRLCSNRITGRSVEACKKVSKRRGLSSLNKVRAEYLELFNEGLDDTEAARIRGVTKRASQNCRRKLRRLGVLDKREE